MENIKKRPWWAFAVLFCLCGVSCLAREFGGGVMLPPTSFFGIWHLFVLTPFELPIWFVVLVLSLPAIGAFILSGITYFITKMAARKKNA